jgi:hypothetical protein
MGNTSIKIELVTLMGDFYPFRTLIFYNLGIDQPAVPQNLKALLNTSPSIFFRIVARPHVHIALGILAMLVSPLDGRIYSKVTPLTNSGAMPSSTHFTRGGCMFVRMKCRSLHVINKVCRILCGIRPWQETFRGVNCEANPLCCKL